MTLLTLATFFGVSFIAAAINSVAGGGTFLTFPIFIMNGLSPLQANIMSTIALWPGTLASVYGYRDTLQMDKTQVRPLFLAGLVGGGAGAIVLLDTPDLVFRALVPWLLLGATLLFIFGRRGIALIRLYFPHRPERPLAGLFMQLAIGFYGGYFGAGIGILTLAMLQIMGLTHIHQMNALKTVLAASVNAVTAIIFMLSGKVLWSIGSVMVCGAVLGGYIGSRLALKIPPDKVRLLVSAIGVSMTVYFFLHKD